MPKSEFQRIWGLAQKLAADSDEEVRRALAFEFCNMHELPQFLPIAQHLAEKDPSPDVRDEALRSMSSLMPAQQAAAFYGQIAARASGEDELWTVVSALRQHSENADVKRVLTQIGQCRFPDVANAAREALS